CERLLNQENELVIAREVGVPGRDDDPEPRNMEDGAAPGSGVQLQIVRQFLAIRCVQRERAAVDLLTGANQPVGPERLQRLRQGRSDRAVSGVATASLDRNALLGAAGHVVREYVLGGVVSVSATRSEGN